MFSINVKISECKLRMQIRMQFTCNIRKYNLPVLKIYTRTQNVYVRAQNITAEHGTIYIYIIMRNHKVRIHVMSFA